MRMNNSYKLRVDDRRCPFRTFADCIVSLLKAWKVTVVRTEHETMLPLDFISSGRSVRKRLPLEKFVDYTQCCESSISFAVFSRHFKNVHSRNCSLI